MGLESIRERNGKAYLINFGNIKLQLPTIVLGRATDSDKSAGPSLAAERVGTGLFLLALCKSTNCWGESEGGNGVWPHEGYTGS